MINFLLKVNGGKIIGSPAERKVAICTIIAMVQFFGCPSVFFTFAPDDIHSVLRSILVVLQKQNTKLKFFFILYFVLCAISYLVERQSTKMHFFDFVWSTYLVVPRCKLQIGNVFVELSSQTYFKYEARCCPKQCGGFQEAEKNRVFSTF